MRTLILSILLFWTVELIAQKTQEPLFTIEGQTDQLYVDQLANIYTVKGDVIRKYLPDGKLQYELSPKRNGKLTLADFNDPLRPMLYYRDQGVIQLLDNTLSEQGDKVDLFELFQTNIWLSCLSIDNHFWFYDTDNFELIRTDRNFTETARSGNLVQVVGNSVMPEWMLERNSILFVSDPDIGVMMFDIFGTYIKTLPVKGLNRFQVIKQVLVYSEENSLCEYRPLDFSTNCIDTPDDCRMVLLGKDKIYLQQADKIAVYSR